MQIIENWTDINGVIHAIAPADVDGFLELSILVEEVAPVGEFANLLAECRGECLRVLVPVDLAESKNVAEGDRVTCRVRRGGPDRIYVHHEHFQVERREGT